MDKRRTVRIVFIGIASILTVTILLLFFNYINPEPPSIEIANARKALSKAGQANAHHYASDKYKHACSLYDSAMYNWQIQNEKYFLKRDFSVLYDFANRALYAAKEAEYYAHINALDLNNALILRMEHIENQIERYDTVINNIPLTKILVEKYTRAKLLYSESKYLFNQKNFKSASKTSDKAELLINEVSFDTKYLLNKYFENYEKWVEWTNEIITWSRRKQSTAIVVNKFAHTCNVYQKGKLKSIYKIELGPNWLGDKHQRGDNATPEGKYRISKKLNSRETKYYKALMIDYPNADDRKQFDFEVKNGSLPENAEIGGLIEMHGDGGKGFHWTNGCIALINEDMDKIYSVTTVGTPVVIVGSLKKPNEFFNLE